MRSFIGRFRRSCFIACTKICHTPNESICTWSTMFSSDRFESAKRLCLHQMDACNLRLSPPSLRIFWIERIKIRQERVAISRLICSAHQASADNHNCVGTQRYCDAQCFAHITISAGSDFIQQPTLERFDSLLANGWASSSHL